MSGPDLMEHRVAVPRDGAGGDERRLAVIDMGSNTFRLVVFRYQAGRSYQLTEEVRETVRLSAGQEEGRLTPDALDRAWAAANLYLAFCEGSEIEDVDAVATSAVRDATNQDEVVRMISVQGRLPVRVLSAVEEAYYGYLGAINSTTLRSGTVLDLGGGSLQLGAVEGRALGRARSWPLGAVRMTERLGAAGPVTVPERRALRRHVLKTTGDLDWLAHGAPTVAMGGQVRTLAAMAQRMTDYPLGEVHGYRLTRESLLELIDQMSALPAAQRTRIPGLKADRADITLAGAVVLDAVMDRVGLDEVEVCAQGLRWGVFYEHYLGRDHPIFPDVRAASVRNVAEIYRYDRVHAEHVARLALRVLDEMTRLGLHGADAVDRELLWAAGLLHDVGVIVDYNDHHKHGEYLVLNAGLPGFDHRELATIALLVRGHRKAMPSTNGLSRLFRAGDDERLARLAVCLRLAEQLERGRGQRVRDLRLIERGDTVELLLDAVEDVTLARWAARNESVAFERATGRPFEVSLRPA